MLRMGFRLRSLHPANVPSFTLPYRAVNGYPGFGDVLLLVSAGDAQVIAAWVQYGAPRGSARTAPAAPAPAPTNTRPPWDPAAC
jgi:hypothetical protein